jgi:hypothetical protein
MAAPMRHLIKKVQKQGLQSGHPAVVFVFSQRLQLLLLHIAAAAKQLLRGPQVCILHQPIALMGPFRDICLLQG